MSRNAPSLSFGAVEGTPFAPIVAAESTTWTDPTAPERLRVVSGEPLGDWLVYAHGGGGSGFGLVGFSVEDVDNHDILMPPSSIEEAAGRVSHTAIGPLTLSPFNSDQLGKGQGSLIANTPQALQPHTTEKSDIAIRYLPLILVGGESSTAERTDSQSLAGQIYGIARHGTLLTAATIVDRVTRSLYGTTRATRYMERHYGDARIVSMDPAPVWRQEQASRGITQPVPPRVVLVRGGQLATQNAMRHLGTYRAHREDRAS